MIGVWDLDKTDLVDSFINSLKSLYDVEFFKDLIEFWQGELRILVYLDSSSKDIVTPSLLSNKLKVARGTITASLNSLEKKGLIERSMSKADKRRIVVILTDDGRDLVRKKTKMVFDHFSILVDELGNENTKELTRLINLSIYLIK